MVFKFSLRKLLRQDICILILRGNLLQQHNAPLNTIFEMVVPDVNMLGPVMEYWINREFYATLVIKMYHRQIHMMTKQTKNYLPHPDRLTCSLTGYHVLCLG